MIIRTFADLINDLDVDVTLDLEKYGKYLKDVRFSCREYRKGEGLRYSYGYFVLNPS